MTSRTASDPAAPCEPQLGRGLLCALARIRRLHRSGAAVSLHDFFAHIGGRSLVLAIGLLALPFTWPLSLGPLTTPASLLIIFLSWQFLRGRTHPQLPARIMATPYPAFVHRILSALLLRLVRCKHWLARPRLQHIVQGERGRRICSVGMMFGGLLLMVPVPMLPLTNTFPALAIFFFALGWLERDGVLTLVGAAANVLGLALIGTIFAIAATAGWEAFNFITQAL